MADADTVHDGNFAAVSYWTLLGNFDHDDTDLMPIRGHAGRFQTALLGTLRLDLLPEDGA